MFGMFTSNVSANQSGIDSHPKHSTHISKSTVYVPFSLLLIEFILREVSSQEITLLVIKKIMQISQVLSNSFDI